jgi:hypothetical protein
MARRGWLLLTMACALLAGFAARYSLGTSAPTDAFVSFSPFPSLSAAPVFSPSPSFSPTPSAPPVVPARGNGKFDLAAGGGTADAGRPAQLDRRRRDDRSFSVGKRVRRATFAPAVASYPIYR